MFLAVVLMSFSMTTFIDVWNRTNYRVLEQSKKKVLTHSEFSFGTKDGFIVAASFYGLNGSTIDPEVGALKFVLKTWGTSSE